MGSEGNVHNSGSPCDPSTWLLPACVSAHGPLLKRTPVLPNLGPILLQYVTMLTNYTCNDPISNKVTFRATEMRTSVYLFWGVGWGTQLTPNTPHLRANLSSGIFRCSHTLCFPHAVSVPGGTSFLLPLHLESGMQLVARGQAGSSSE